MKCPKCGENVLPGTLAPGGYSSNLFWLPKSYFEKHLFGIAWPTKKKIEKEGGILIKTRNNMSEAVQSYGCTKCKIVITECE